MQTHPTPPRRGYGAIEIALIVALVGPIAALAVRAVAGVPCGGIECSVREFMRVRPGPPAESRPAR